MNGAAHIEVRDLSMAYGDFVVQRDLDFTVNKGDIFVVMGGNGCGKTTLLLAGGIWFGERKQHVLYFEGAAQGLQVGAPVVFLGVKVGTVKQIQLGLDPQSHRFLVPVTIEVEPQVVHAHGGENIDLRDRSTVRQLVERGLRARLRLQSLLTGQLYVDLDFHPEKPATFAALDPGLSEIPTIRTATQELTSKLEGFPMDKFLADVAAISGAVNQFMSAQATQQLPKRLDSTLRHLESLAARFDAQGGPILKDVRGKRQKTAP